jgi:NAD(P)H-nitrite reductase large subunit
MPTKHVIIGNGPAGMHAIGTIRKHDPSGSEIHVLSNEPAYSRMVIPYWMAGTIDESHVLTANDEFYGKHRVTPHLGKSVAGVDPKARRVTIDGGETIEFDTLLIASGSSAVKLPIPGSDLPGVHNLWTMDDARAIAPRSKPGQKVLFIGAGFIGFIVLNAFYKKGCKLAVVELEKHVLPRMLDAACAELATKWLSSKGVDIHCGTSVAKIEARDQKLVAALSNGQAIECDSIVISAGIKPNVGFLQGSGIEVDKGVLVDQYLRTNFPQIYAAGDCAQGPDLLTGERAIHAIQPTAIDHGRVAGANMVGKNVAYDGSLLMNVLDLCGLQTASFGRWSATSDAPAITNETRPIYRKLLFDGDRIIGAILLGQTGDLSTLNDMGMIKGFIQTKTALGEWHEYLRHHPQDIRRAYIACGVATKLLNKTLLPEPTEDVGYRHEGAQPDSAVDRGPHHKVFADTWAAAMKGYN